MIVMFVSPRRLMNPHQLQLELDKYGDIGRALAEADVLHECVLELSLLIQLVPNIYAPVADIRCNFFGSLCHLRKRVGKPLIHGCQHKHKHKLAIY